VCVCMCGVYVCVGEGVGVFVPVPVCRLLPYAHHSNGSKSFVRLLTKKQMEVIRSQTGLTGIAHL
jgi:hypothetical protein